jgi:hypothetical protein
MGVFNPVLWVVGLALAVAVEKGETLQMLGVKTAAVFGDSHSTIRGVPYMEPG